VRVIRSGMARGTTSVSIAESTVDTTISSPTRKAITASTSVTTASTPLRQTPRRRASVRALAASRSRSLGTQTRWPPAPVR
jgi:hypothetical protein